jgi:hypothetical protein
MDRIPGNHRPSRLDLRELRADKEVWWHAFETEGEASKPWGCGSRRCRGENVELVRRI